MPLDGPNDVSYTSSPTPIFDSVQWNTAALAQASQKDSNGITAAFFEDNNAPHTIPNPRLHSILDCLPVNVSGDRRSVGALHSHSEHVFSSIEERTVLPFPT